MKTGHAGHVILLYPEPKARPLADESLIFKALNLSEARVFFGHE